MITVGGKERRLGVNLTAKVALPLLLQFMGAVAGLVTFTSYLRRTEYDGHVIDVAGRQRMLSVEIRAHAHMVSMGQREDQPGLTSLVREFDTALGALRGGGTVGDVWVPPAPEGTRAELSALVSVWAPLERRLAIVAEAPPSDPRFIDASGYVEAHAPELRTAAGRFVRAYAVRVRRLRSRMLRVLVGIAGFSVALLLASIFVARRYIVRPVRRLEEVARAVGAGDLSMRLDDSTGDEFAALARCFNEMSSRLRQTLTDLDRQRRQAQTVVSSVPSGLALLRDDMTVLHANRALCEILGATPDEVVGRVITEVLPLPHLQERIAGVVAESQPVHGLVYTLERDGHPARKLRLTIVGTRHAQEEAEEEAPVLLLVEDMSEEERLRAHARVAEARFHEVVEHATDGIVIMGLDGVVQYFNRACEQMFGRPREAVIGQPVTLLMSEKHRAPHEGKLRPPMSDGASRIVGKLRPVEGLRADGSIFPVEITITTIDVGGDRMFVGVLRDVTERQQLTARMMQMDRIISVGTLAASVGHEINNPLTYVMANLGVALEEIDELTGEDWKRSASMDTVCEMLREAQEGAERIRDIVRDLRTFSRADEDSRGPVDIRKVLESSIHMGFNEIRHRARLVKDYSGTLPVEGNESRLGQVFLNLLVNAAHAMPEGASDTHEIRVRTFMADGRVVVEVADTGAGIRAEDLPRIFAPFFTTKPVGQGTGLGLSICRKIIEDHGGEIDVQSEVGKGTTFRVCLPVARDEEPAPRDADPSQRQGPRGRILVVDDELKVARILCRTLAGEHDVVVVTGAVEALERLDAGEHFDIILCDIMMPDMTGMCLHDRLAESLPDMARRMVFLTGGAFTPRAREFLARVENPCIDKPFLPRNLRVLVRDILRAHGGPAGQESGG